MNVIDGASLFATLAMISVATVLFIVTLTYFLRPKVRAHFPGGTGRYLLALTLQATALILPVPFVVLAVMGFVPAGLDVLLGFVAGYTLVLLLRHLPLTGPLLTDLARARLQSALETHPPKSKPPESRP